jgi:hypothetical protein
VIRTTSTSSTPRTWTSSASGELKPHQEQRNTGLPYSPIEQVHNEFVVNSSLPSSLESIGVRTIQRLVQVKVRSVSRHVAVAIHVIDVAAVVAVDAVVRVTKVAFLRKPSDHTQIYHYHHHLNYPNVSFPTFYHLPSKFFLGGLPIPDKPNLYFFGYPFSFKEYLFKIIPLSI